MTAGKLAVPFNGLVLENAEVGVETRAAIDRVIGSSWFIGGTEVQRFESRVATETDTEHAIAVNSGTDALRLALRMFDLQPGSEIITVANTFVATVGAAIAEGHTVKLVDVGTDENIDVQAVERAITPHTSAVIAVHLRGLPSDMIALRALCGTHGLVLIEDCAQALSASISDQKVGSFGAAGCFSMHPLKNLGAFGDAGVVVTNDSDVAHRMREYRNHGLVDRDTVSSWGINSRLDALHAAVLNVKFDRLDGWTETRRQIAARYNQAFVGLPIQLPGDGLNSRHVYHRYVIRASNRDALRNYLLERGIETAIHYPVPIHRQAAMSSPLVCTDSSLPVTESDASSILSLPLYPQLTDFQVDHVCRSVIDFYDEAKDS